MTYSDGTNSGFSRRNHYVGQPAVKSEVQILTTTESLKKSWLCKESRIFCVLSAFDSMA